MMAKAAYAVGDKVLLKRGWVGDEYVPDLVEGTIASVLRLVPASEHSMS